MQLAAAADTAVAVAVDQDSIQTNHACCSTGDCERGAAEQLPSVGRPTMNASDDHTVDNRRIGSKRIQTQLVLVSTD